MSKAGVWVIVAISCSECDHKGIRVLAHKPTEGEIGEVKKFLGGNWCIHSYVVRVEINGKPVSFTEGDYD